MAEPGEPVTTSTKLAIGIAGRARRGKGTIASIMTDYCAAHQIPCQIVSFADPLKDFLTSVVGRREPFRGNDADRNAPIPEMTWGDFAEPFQIAAIELFGDVIRPDVHPTGRQLMQLYGTDVIRKYFMADVWVRIAKNKCRDFNGVTLIDDVRFPNEAATRRFAPDRAVFDLTVRVDRPGFPLSNHASEVSVDQIPAEYLATVFDNAGTIDDLKDKVVGWAELVLH